jgi:hypothetical protein
MLFRLIGSLLRGASKVRTDRYGNQRVFGGGPRVKNGPNKGLLRARNKGGNWRGKHKFK